MTAPFMPRGVEETVDGNRVTWTLKAANSVIMPEGANLERAREQLSLWLWLTFAEQLWRYDPERLKTFVEGEENSIIIPMSQYQKLVERVSDDGW